MALTQQVKLKTPIMFFKVNGDTIDANQAKYIALTPDQQTVTTGPAYSKMMPGSTGEPWRSVVQVLSGPMSGWWCSTDDVLGSTAGSAAAAAAPPPPPASLFGPVSSTPRYVLVDVLNVRGGPGTSYGVLGKLKRGDKITDFQPVTKDSDWGFSVKAGGCFALRAGGKEYVSTKPPAPVPTAAPLVAKTDPTAAFEPKAAPEPPSGSGSGTGLLVAALVALGIANA